MNWCRMYIASGVLRRTWDIWWLLLKPWLTACSSLHSANVTTTPVIWATSVCFAGFGTTTWTFVLWSCAGGFRWLLICSILLHSWWVNSYCFACGIGCPQADTLVLHRADEATIGTVSRLNVKFGSAFWAGIARLKIILHFVSHYTIVFCCTTTNGGLLCTFSFCWFSLPLCMILALQGL